MLHNFKQWQTVSRSHAAANGIIAYVTAQNWFVDISPGYILELFQFPHISTTSQLKNSFRTLCYSMLHMVMLSTQFYSSSFSWKQCQVCMNTCNSERPFTMLPMYTKYQHLEHLGTIAAVDKTQSHISTQVKLIMLLEL